MFRYCKTIKTIKGYTIIKTLLTEKCKKIIKNNLEIKPIIVLEVDKSTLLIKILSFNFPDITNLFLRELKRFKLEEYDNIIFDIRDNPGGSISETCRMMECIAPKTIEYPYVIRDRNLNEQKRVINGTNILELNKNSKHIFAFINENTASTAEYIFLQGILLAFPENIKLIGRQTQGTSGQAAVYRITESIVLNVTVKRYYNDNGEELNVGYKPDIEIETTLESQHNDIFLEKYKEEFVY